MKPHVQNRTNRKSLWPRMCLLGGAFAMLGLASTSLAAGTNMISTNVVGGSSGWFSSGVWKTNNGSGVPVGTGVSAPVPGNTYTLIQGSNPAIGNNLAGTRTRNPYTNGTPNPVIFPGDSLTLTVNTEIRFKRVGSGNVPTVVFPGVGGNPGLILNGGMLNMGDGDVMPIGGIIQAAPGSQSYICPGNNDFASVDNARGFNISASLIGSGTLVVVEGPTTTAVNISGTNNTYSGLWLVKSGWLLGSGPGSLGTNSSFTVDPQYTLPSPPLDATAASAAAGPAILEPGYDLNSAGTLTLINGGQVKLHQNCAFTAVTIEGQVLSPGRHYYSELAATFAATANFPAGGSGAITVQPYGPLPLIFLTQPLPQMVYAGRTAHFRVAATGPGTITYQWRKNGVNLTDGANISGSTTTNLVVSNVSGTDQASYDVVVSNGSTPITSTAVALTVVSPSGEPYEAAVLAANPAAFYQLNETSDPSTSPYAFDYAGGGVGNYGIASQNGFNNIAGPTASVGFTGFQAANKAILLANAIVGSRVTIPAWNLNTNNVTITAWINPSGGEVAATGLVFCRGGTTVAGLDYSSAVDLMGNRTLGYTWNNEWETYTWDSGIAPPAGQWSFVALVISPTSATIHVMNTNGFLQATHTYAHVPQAFDGTTLIGDDSLNANGTRAFSGNIDDVAVFASSLTKAQLAALYAAGLGSTPAYPPTIATAPAPLTLYAGQTATFRVAGGGSDPLTYQWKRGAMGSGVYANLADGGNISGSTTDTLVISNISNSDMMDYIVVLTNPAGTTNSTPAAALSVLPTSPAQNITMLGVLQPGGADWDTGASWSDGNPASYSAAMEPGSTYRLASTGTLNTRMRSPQNPRTAIFPGVLLTVDGTGVFTNNFGTNGNTAEIRFKQPNPGTVIFPHLVMNGGQIDAGNDGVVEVGGWIEFRTNTPVYNDGGGDRGYLFNAQLTGAGSIEYRGYAQNGFMSNYVNNLNVACPTNNFTGKWNVVIGTLLATGTNSLGTNDIIIGANAAFEPTYNLNNTNGSLYLSGRMYLHQDHTFKSLFVNGAPLSVGKYTFAQLNAAYPANFPNAWMPLVGAASYTNGGSGSITVLVQPAPSIVQQPLALSKYPTETAQFTVTAAGNPPLYYRWRKDGVALADGGNISGSTTNTITITNLAAANGGNYDVVVTNSIGSVTSTPALLTIKPTGPALNLTLNYDYAGTGPAPIIQPSGNDWNTITNWSDGNPASVSALSNPGSTYDVIPGSRLRSPANDPAAIFPGVLLKVDGDGVWTDGGTATIGEIRFKHSSTPATCYFKKLVMNGGQLDTGDNGLIVIAGGMDILANTPIYVDSAAGQDRSYQIDAWLTGTAGIEFHQWGTGFGGNLNITGTSNTFSGKWTIVQGCVLGSGLNSLGTNDIVVGTNSSVAALETLYNINNRTGSLIVDTMGQIFLHQDDRFRAVTVAGVPLAVGTYTFSQLNAAYPANFPLTWPQQVGSPVATASGSITVLGDVPPLPTTPTNIVFSVASGSLQLQWPSDYTGWLLLEQTNQLVSGISTNRLDWGTVPGSSTTNRVFIPISSSRASEFYKLAYP